MRGTWLGALLALAACGGGDPGSEIAETAPPTADPGPDVDAGADSGSAAGEVALGPAAAEGAEAGGVADPDAAPVEGGETQARELTTVEALERFFGARWGSVLPRYQLAKTDLDAPASFPPWEEVEPRLREEFLLDRERYEELVERHSEWPAEPDAAAVGELLGRASLSPEELERAIAAAEPFREEIDAEARIYVDMISEARRQLWEEGRVTVAPLIGLPVPQRAEPVFDSGILSLDGWTVLHRVWSSDFPWIVEQRRVLKGRIRERLQAVQSALE